MSTSLQEKVETYARVEVPNTNKKMPGKKTVFVVALIAVMGVALCYLLTQNNSTVSNEFEYENNATVGLMPGVDRDALLAEMQNNVDESAIAFSLNSSPVLENAQINILFENPVGNNKDIVLEIFENATQNSLYKSKAIKEGNYIEKAKLNTALGKGEHPVTVYITAYDVETHEIIGQAAAEITIHSI